MAKYTEIAAMMKRRIVNGDYTFSRIPGARKLAEETGVSYMTARQAVQKLLDDGIIARAANGWFAATDAPARRQGLKIACVSPVKHENYYLWEHAIKTVADEYGGSFRLVVFSHEDDPVIVEVLNGDFDLVFITHSLDNSSFITNQVKKNAAKVVTLFQDLTADGVRCLDGPDSSFTTRMIEHLRDLGHREIDAFFVFGTSLASNERLHCWREAIDRLGLSGRLHREVLPPFVYALRPAYDYFVRMLERGDFTATALFVPIMENIIGLLRCCRDHGIVVGRDLSICGFGQPELASMLTPSVTVIDRPNPIPLVREIVRQELEAAPGKRRLMYRPPEGKVIIGESTGPAPATPPRSRFIPSTLSIEEPR